MAHPISLLIVDDSERMRRLIRRVLKSVSAEVWECCDGSQAFEAYRNHRPDCVLMDIEMKVVDGIAATSQIRAAFPDARIVIISNYDSDELRAAAREAGALAFCNKANLLSLRSLIRGSD